MPQIKRRHFCLKLKIYCTVLPYFENVSRLHQRMPVGLSILVLDCHQSRKYCKAIIKGLLLFTSTKKSDMAKLEDLLKVLFKNGLKISLKKFQ